MRVSSALFALTALSGAFAHIKAQKCRCLFGQSCWPSAAEQKLFSATLSHPLINVHPIGLPCHDPNFNGAACANVLAHAENGTWRADQVGASQYTNAEELGFGAEQCLPDTPENTTCSQGNGGSRYG
jgi:hypothetical protein